MGWLVPAHHPGDAGVTPAWRWSGARRWNKEVRGKRGLSQLPEVADTPDGARGPPVALPADMEDINLRTNQCCGGPGGDGATRPRPGAPPLPTPPETPHHISATVVLSREYTPSMKTAGPAMSGVPTGCEPVSLNTAVPALGTIPLRSPFCWPPKRLMKKVSTARHEPGTIYSKRMTSNRFTMKPKHGSEEWKSGLSRSPIPLSKRCSKSTLRCVCPPSVLTGTTISRTTDNGAMKPQYAE